MLNVIILNHEHVTGSGWRTGQPHRHWHRYRIHSNPRQSLTVNIHCEFSSRFHSDSKRIRSGFESKRRESLRIHNVFAQQYGFANFGRVFTVIRCETLSCIWVKGELPRNYVSNSIDSTTCYDFIFDNSFS